MDLVCGDTNPPSCASTCSSTGTPPHKPCSAGFPAKGRSLQTPGSYRQGWVGFRSETQGGRDLVCPGCVWFCASLAALQHLLSTGSGGSSALLHVPAPAPNLLTGCCSQDTFCALPPPTHIIWIHIIKRLAAEIAHRKIILNWFINAHLRRILKYDKNMRATEKGSEWE